MNKKEFYREQAEKFRDYASKFPERDLLSLFEEWAESKDFSDEDMDAIFREFISIVPDRIKKHVLAPKLNIHLRNDPIALRDIIKFILLAIELGEEENELDKDTG